MTIVCLQVNKTVYVKIYCVGSAEHPARIEVFDNKKSANKGNPLLYCIRFSNVKSVVSIETQGKQCITITLQEDDVFTFSTTGSRGTELLGYCKLLFTLPGDIIPEIPKRCLVSQQHIEQHSDPSRYDASKYLKWLLSCIRLYLVWCRVTSIKTRGTLYNALWLVCVDSAVVANFFNTSWSNKNTVEAY